MFAVRGVDGVAVRDLAREMGLTAPSLYNHFPSKQALYDAVLERGLKPIVELVAAAWQPGELQVDRMRRATVEGLMRHTAHPHLAQLIQRALLDESRNVRALIQRWLVALYRQGIAVLRDTAEEAGWEPAEIPNLAVGLFGLVFSYFANVATLRAVGAWSGDPFSPRALTGQKAFLEKAIYRLLGPQPGGLRG